MGVVRGVHSLLSWIQGKDGRKYLVLCGTSALKAIRCRIEDGQTTGTSELTDALDNSQSTVMR